MRFARASESLMESKYDRNDDDELREYNECEKSWFRKEVIDEREQNRLNIYTHSVCEPLSGRQPACLHVDPLYMSLGASVCFDLVTDNVMTCEKRSCYWR